jgi:asparagine N-glycosylation enzyme membrane subunit Stt3
MRVPSVLWSDRNGRGVPNAVRSRARFSSVFFRVATPVLLFLAAIGVRMLAWHSVFQQSGVYPNGNDAYYHFRRIRYSIDHFPKVLDFDQWINFPNGAQPIWSPTFDWLMAAWHRCIPGIDEPNQLERFAVLVPPVIGALTVLVVFFVGLRFFSRRVALIAAASMAILPAHSIYSRLGAVDHHVLVAAVVAVMLALAMSLFRAQSGRATDRDGSPSTALSIGLGLSIAAAVLVWPGSLLHVAVLQVAMVIQLLCAADLASARLRARQFAIVHVVSALAVYPMSAGNEWVLWGGLSPVVLSNFQPLYFLIASICFASLGVMWRFGLGASTRLARLVSSGLLGAALLIGILISLPDLRSAIFDALSWFAKDESFQAVVNESAPLFGGARGSARALAFLGGFVYFVPLAVVYFGWRSRERAEVLLLLGWGFALFLATLVQWRFMNSFAIAYCLLIGVAFDSAARALRSRLSGVSSLGPRWVSAATALILGAITLVAFAAPLQSYRLHFENVGRSLRGEDPVAVGALVHTRFVADVARFIRDNSPTFEEAQYSVLGPWGDGHILKYVAERAIVQDNFGDDVAPENFALAEQYFSSRDESTALGIVSPLKTRYVLVRSTGSGHSEGYAPDSLFRRLYRLNGSRGPASGGHGSHAGSTDALGQHRLIYQSAPLREGGLRPYCMLFEIVEGARLVGRAEPGDVVRVRLEVEPKSGRPFTYTARTITDPAGDYAIRLPYSNESVTPDIEVGGHYDIRIGSKNAEVTVSEAAVQEGSQIAGPSFSD